MKLLTMILVLISAFMAEALFDIKSGPSYTFSSSSIDDKDITLVDKSKIDKTLPLKILVHGFKALSVLSSTQSKWPGIMREAILKKNPKVNVLINYWKSPTGGIPYGEDAKYTRQLGADLAAAIVRLGLENSAIHCIGHSLGSHICGFAGKAFKASTNRKFSRISGLDPAGPEFRGKTLLDRLDSSDADFVDVYHTNMGSHVNRLGLNEKIGHSDFYPNGGEEQPSCGNYRIDKNIIKLIKGEGIIGCSHSTAYEYYTESIKDSTCFDGYEWKSDGLIYYSPAYAYGYAATKLNPEQRSFYTVTSKSAPYCCRNCKV